MRGRVDSEIDAMKLAVIGFYWTSLKAFRLLIDDLDMRASRIRDQLPDWEARFRHAWEPLEEVYAVMVDRDMSTPDEVFQEIISNSIDRLRIVLLEDSSE